MTNEKIQHATALLNAITPGNWAMDVSYCSRPTGPDEIRGAGPICRDSLFKLPCAEQAWKDAEFIAEAPVLLRSALKEIECLKNAYQSLYNMSLIKYLMLKIKLYFKE